MATHKALKKDRGIWLVGGTLESITGSKLPSNQQVLGRFFHLHNKEKETIASSATTTAEEVLQFWDKARIPTRKKCHIIDKIKVLHSKWQDVQRNKTRRTALQLEKEATFAESMPDLFDVVYADALTLATVLEEDKLFLLAQREKGRRGSMGPVDTKLLMQEKKREERMLKEESRRKKEEERLMGEAAVMGQHLSSESCDEVNKLSSDYEIDPSVASTSKTSKVQKMPMIDIISQDVASALDRTKTSDRNAIHVLAATAKSLGYNPDDMILNRESVRLARRSYRETVAQEIQASFAPNAPLTVHWDGKMLPALTSKEKVDRLAVMVSGGGVMKLLGVPAIQNGTGNAQASAVFSLLEDWNITDRVQFMSFDTTASNTGRKTGACLILQQKMNRELLSLPCRHHIFELIVGSVFEVLIESSSGPNIKLFRRFFNAWKNLDKETFESGMADEAVAEKLEPMNENLLAFIQCQLTNFQPRDDYKELLQLAQLFLGEGPEKLHCILAPGAFHHARWMAKIIYCLKIYLFRSQFHLTRKQLSGLREFNIFIIQVYLKSWFTAPCPAAAPRNDLSLLKKLHGYKEVNAPVANAALKSFSRHLWYLSERMSGLAFFDSEISAQEKIILVKSLEKQGADDIPPARIPHENLDVNGILEMKLSDFLSRNSRKLFDALGVCPDFIKEDPNTWGTNADFIDGQRKVLMMKVVNDAAERGVALIQEFNGVLTNQEEQKQYLLQLVETSSPRLPRCEQGYSFWKIRLQFTNQVNVYQNVITCGNYLSKVLK